jgi:alpha-1,3-glucosyltransferase
MYGILVLSMVLARNSSTLLLSGLLFAILLCFKHIYLYLAPAYFVYLLRAYCLGSRGTFPYFNIQFLNCIKLGVGIIAIFASAFGPFALWGQMEQVFRRLFPFSRGLCHAYWAPNVWAMYSFVDRVLIYGTVCAAVYRTSLTLTAAPRLGLKVDPEAVNSVTRGLVGDTSFAVLPDVVPLTCFLFTLGAQIVSSSLLPGVDSADVYSLSSFDCSTNPPGKPLLAQSRSVGTRLSSSAGMYTRKRSSWSSFLSA